MAAAAVLVATRSPDGPVRSDWWLGSPPSGAGLAIVTYVGSSSCNEFDRIEVSESEDAVVVMSYVSRGGGDCTADDSYRATPVTLDAPLGKRRLEGCTAPPDGNRAGDIPHADTSCEELVRPDHSDTVTGDHPSD